MGALYAPAIRVVKRPALRALHAGHYDMSGALRRNTRRLPPHLAAEIDLLVSASRRLREERGRRSVKRPS